MSTQKCSTDYLVVMHHDTTPPSGHVVYVTATRAKAEAEARRLNASAPVGGDLRYEVAPA